MVAFLAVVCVLLRVYSQAVFYVTSKGSDSSTCGSQNDPCATINQVLINYPGSSYSVSIGIGTYTPTKIALQRDAVVIFQGTGNPTLTPSWGGGLFITNTYTSGFEFHDVSITLAGSGTFTTLNDDASVGGFYNVCLTYENYTSEMFVNLYGGSMVFSNVTIVNSTFKGYLFYDTSGTGGNIELVVTKSTFTNVITTGEGGFLLFQGLGGANITINSSTFTGIDAHDVFINFSPQDSNQVISITNNVFRDIYTEIPSVSIQNNFQSVVYVDNTTWDNATSYIMCGALYVLGTGLGDDYNVTLTNLKFNDCYGYYAGGIYIVDISFNISNSSFSDNYGRVANDVVLGEDSASDYGCSITNCYSSSPLVKAVVWNSATGALVDISNQFPNPSTEMIPVVLLSLGKEPEHNRNITTTQN